MNDNTDVTATQTWGKSETRFSSPNSSTAAAARQFLDRRRPDYAAKWADDAQWAARLPHTLSWKSLADLYDARFHPKDQLAIPGRNLTDDNSDADTDRANTMSTRNPEAKWDYWSIGGGWRGHFAVKHPGAGLILTPPEHPSPGDVVSADQTIRCDGGPKSLLDFEAMRCARAVEADRRYDQWETVCEATPVV
ncbi:hypothetical protein [Actinoplanes sp. NPDC051859]|uniref:hypothetical protein n=1 Tax=Actinoplanes sp. NPDC051859 TaxID=3363909 RepID=UPI0037A4F0F0